MQRIPEISNSYSLIEEIVFGFTQSVNPKKYIDKKIYIYSVNTARFLKYVWPVYNIMHERVNG